MSLSSRGTGPCSRLPCASCRAAQSVIRTRHIHSAVPLAPCTLLPDPADGGYNPAMFVSHTITFVKGLMSRVIAPGDIAVDATVGNGVDTRFLSRQVGPDGRVFGFDIQRRALDETRRRLTQDEAHDNVTLIHAGHEAMAEHLPAEAVGRVAGVMFNLGYLPSSVESVITRPETTCAAIDAALAVLRPGGVASLVVYTGHPGGEDEARAVLDHCAGLHLDLARVRRCDMHNHAACQTRLLFLERR